MNHDIPAMLTALACVVSGVRLVKHPPRGERDIPWTAITLFSAALMIYNRRR